MVHLSTNKPVDVPGAEVREVAELGGKHPLGAVHVGQLDRCRNLFCKRSETSLNQILLHRLVSQSNTTIA
jgi:hypothetical protein